MHPCWRSESWILSCKLLPGTSVLDLRVCCHIERKWFINGNQDWFHSLLCGSMRCSPLKKFSRKYWCLNDWQSTSLVPTNCFMDWFFWILREKEWVAWNVKNEWVCVSHFSRLLWIAFAASGIKLRRLRNCWYSPSKLFSMNESETVLEFGGDETHHDACYI